MLGIYRYILAMAVTLTHLWRDLAAWAGVAAVFGFYLLSGYLITTILHESYGFGRRGIGKYAMNRFLRLYPTYWTVMIFSVIVISVIPQYAVATAFKLTMPQDALAWFQNVAIVGLLNGTMRVPVPPAWSLDIEIIFYVLMALGLSRHKIIVTSWFVCSVVYTIWLNAHGAHFTLRYSTYLAASLPFSCGAMLYMFREDVERWIKIPVVVAAGLLFLAYLAGRLGWVRQLGIGFYLVLVGNFLMVAALRNIRAGDQAPWIAKLDRIAGNLAYPIFLCHWPVAAVVYAVFFSEAPKRPDAGYFWFVSFIFVNLFSLLIFFGVDKNVNRLRDHVRGKKSLRDKRFA